MTPSCFFSSLLLVFFFLLFQQAGYSDKNIEVRELRGTVWCPPLSLAMGIHAAFANKCTEYTGNILSINLSDIKMPFFDVAVPVKFSRIYRLNYLLVVDLTLFVAPSPLTLRACSIPKYSFLHGRLTVYHAGPHALSPFQISRLWLIIVSIKFRTY